VSLVLSRPLISLDLETTGTHNKIDRVVQIGLVKCYPDGTNKEWSTLVNPGIHIPNEATAIHGFDDLCVKDAPHFKDVVSILYNGLSDCDITGYNVDFDLRFLKAEFSRLGMQPPRWGRVVCSYKLFRKMEPHNLAAAVRFYTGTELQGAHDAEVDAGAALGVLYAQLEHYPHLPKTIDELADYLEQPTGDTVDAQGKLAWRNNEVVINFGDKWAGVPLRSVDRSYLEWIARSEFSTHVKSVVNDALNGKYLRRDK